MRAVLLCIGAILAAVPFLHPQSKGSPPVPVSMPLPEFPDTAKRFNLTGNVVLETFIMPDGKVGMAHALKGHQLFYSNAENALSQWTFKVQSGDGLRRILTEVRFYEKTLGGSKNVVLTYWLSPDGRWVQFGPPLVLPVDKCNIPAKKEWCKIHGAELIVGEVPIVYGDIYTAPVYLKARADAAKNFPQSNRSYYGGMSECPETRAFVRYCPRCRIAEEKWERLYLKEHVPTSLHR